MNTLDQIIKVAIVGPECTGKSVVAEHLAKCFNTVCVPEYSRTYCEGLNRNYTMEDEMNIFYGQLETEAHILKTVESNIVFMDTMILTVKIWCDYLFGFTPQPVLDTLQEVDYDLYLLMDVDLPWEEDALRDFPMLRTYFKGVWQRELEAIQAPYVLISGLGDARFVHAEQAVRTFLTTKKDSYRGL